MRFLNLLVAALLFSNLVNASTSKSYSVQFWTQDLSTLTSLPKSLGTSQSILFEKNWNLTSDQAFLWEKSFDNENLKAILQVFAPTASYLAQQITIYENNELIGRCTAYYGPNEILVPAACSAKSNKTLIGFSIIQK